MDEQATAHADATVDAPHRELDADALERFAPREHVLVHAVHERAVEIEQEGGAGGHESGNVIVVNEVGAQHAAPLRLCVTPSCYVVARRLSSFSSIDRKSTRLNSSHLVISYAVFCLKKKKKIEVCSRKSSCISCTCSNPVAP